MEYYFTFSPDGIDFSFLIVILPCGLASSAVSPSIEIWPLRKTRLPQCLKLLNCENGVELRFERRWALELAANAALGGIRCGYWSPYGKGSAAEPRLGA